MTGNDVYAHLSETAYIETKRLVLKRLTPKNAEALYKIASDPRVSKYLLWDPHPSFSYTKSYLKNLLKLYKNHTYFEWGVFLKENNVLIGTCGFTAFNFLSKSAEIGYSYGYQYWGRGYATEALSAVIKYGFEELKLNHINACFALDNTASGAVLDKCGMQYIGEGEHMIIKGCEYHIGMYTISNDMYKDAFSNSEVMVSF